MLETRLVRVRGIRRAYALGVTGWVRNRMDGSMEAIVHGSPEQLTDMCAWLVKACPSHLSTGSR
jgi:acylphosphatase